MPAPTPTPTATPIEVAPNPNCPKLEIVDILTPYNFIDLEPGERTIDTIVLHWTAGTAEIAVDWFHDPASGVSAHYVIAKDGRIYRVVKEEDVALQAFCPRENEAEWACYRPGTHLHSIGIELENWAWVTPDGEGGFLNYRGEPYHGQPEKVDPPFMEKEWFDPYPQAQREALLCLTLGILSRHPQIAIDPEHILGHYQVQAKLDPGPLLDLDEFRQSLREALAAP